MESILAKPGSRPCPVCSGTALEAWGSKKELHLFKCVTCGMIFEPVVPAEFHAGHFYETAGAEFYLSPDKLRSDQSPVRYTRELQLFNQRVQTGKILDVGCGTGGFLNQLRMRHPGQYVTEGTDVSGPALDHAESLGLTIHRGKFTEFPIAESTYDAVTFWAVLEHLAEPEPFLQQAYRILKPGGICFGLVPNIESLAVRLLGMKYRYIFPQHVNYFSRQTLDKMFRKAGSWASMETTFTHFNPIVIWQDWRRGIDFVPDDERARLLVKTNAMKENPKLKPVQMLYRASEAILAAAGLADNVVIIARKS